MTIIVITKDFIATDGLSTSANRILALNMDKFVVNEDASLSLFCGSLSDSLTLLNNTLRHKHDQYDLIRDFNETISCGIIRVGMDGFVGEALFNKKDGYITGHNALVGEVVLGSGRDFARSYLAINRDLDDSKGARTLGAVKHVCNMVTSCGGTLSLISRKSVVSYGSEDSGKGWLVHDFHPDGTESSRVINFDGSKKRVLDTFHCTENEINTIPAVVDAQEHADQWWAELHCEEVDSAELMEEVFTLEPDFIDENWLGSSRMLFTALISTPTNLNIEMYAARLGVSHDALSHYVELFMKVRVCDIVELTNIYGSENFWEFMTAVKIAYSNPLQTDRPYITHLWSNKLAKFYSTDILAKAYHNEMSIMYGTDVPALETLIYQPEPDDDDIETIVALPNCPDFINVDWMGSSKTVMSLAIAEHVDNLQEYADALDVSEDDLSGYIRRAIEDNAFEGCGAMAVRTDIKFWTLLDGANDAFSKQYLSAEDEYELAHLLDELLENNSFVDIEKAYLFEISNSPVTLCNLVGRDDAEGGLSYRARFTIECEYLSKLSIGSCNAFNIWFDNNINSQVDYIETKIPEYLLVDGVFNNSTVWNYASMRFNNLKSAFGTVSNTTIYKSPRFWSLVEYVVNNNIQTVNRECMERIYSTNGATKDIVNLLSFELSVIGHQLDIDMDTIVAQVSLIGKGTNAIYEDGLFINLTNKQYHLNQIAKNPNPIRYVLEVQQLHNDIDILIAKLCETYMRTPDEIKELI